MGAESDDGVGVSHQFSLDLLPLQRLLFPGPGLHFDAGQGVKGDGVGDAQVPAERPAQPAGKPVVGMDQLVVQPLPLLKLPHPPQKLRQMPVQLSEGGIRFPGGQVDDPHLGGKVDYWVAGRPVLPGENVHGRAALPQGAGQLAHINIHPPGLALPGGRQGTGVERDESDPGQAQLFRATIR